MNKKHCDFCDQVITGEFYRVSKHSVNEDGAHFPALKYDEMCEECYQWFKVAKELDQKLREATGEQNMNKKHCDLCDQVIEGDFYQLTRRIKGKGDFGYREICLDCIKKILSDEEIQGDEV